MTRSAAVLAAGLVLAAGSALMAADAIVNPHVTTDRSVDTRTVKAIVDSLVKPAMSDQDKAVAIYNYVRRTMFHYRTYTRYGGGGALNLINGTGYCLCTPTAGAQCELLEAAGLKARILDTRNHGSVVVFFDGAWHWMDAFLGGCVYGSDGKTLADLPAVVADPSLLRRDNPSPVALLPCRDLLYADAIRFEPDNKECQAGSGPDDFAWAAKSNPGKRGENGWASSMTMDITLRPGESYVRNWDGEPGMFFLHNTQERFAPPHHFCGVQAEQRDVANWPLFKPYVKEITSFDPKAGKQTTIKTGRYWANGHLTWTPNLKDPDALKHFARAENVKLKDGVIELLDASKPGVIEIEVKCPYMLQDGMISFVAVGGGTAAASIRVDQALSDKAPKTQPERKFEPLDTVPAKFAKMALLRPCFAKDMGTRGYRVRFELAGEGASLQTLAFDTIFQHNMYSQPQLMPGKNEIKIVLANPDALAKTKFCVELAWEEQGQAKSVNRRIDKSPFTFTIDVAGEDLPRMNRLLLANEGRAE